MEEKGTDTNRHKSSLKSNSTLYLFDEYYYKHKEQNKGLRCKSAINHPNLPFNIDINNFLRKRNKKKNKLNSRKYFFFHNDLLEKTKNNNNTYNIELLTSKSRNKLNSNIRTINLSGIFKLNESKIKLDTTKHSTKRTKFSAKCSSNYSYYKLNDSYKTENKKLYQSKSNNNILSVINIKPENFFKNDQIIKKQTLKDITIQNLTNRIKTAKPRKINRNKYNIGKTRNKIYEIYPLLNSDNNNKRKKIEYKNNLVRNKDDFKTYELNKQKNYKIKYSFFQNTMDNISHKINFVDIEKDEELYQNVLIDFQNKKNMKYEDFKTMGYELNPEELYILNQNKKQKLFKEKYENMKQNYILENIQKIEANKLLKQKTKKNYVPEYKLKFKNKNWKNKNYESIYKYNPIKYSSKMKKKSLRRKINFIKYIFDVKKLKRNKSVVLSTKLSNAFDKINKQSKNKRQSVIYKSDSIKSPQLKNILNNNIKNHENYKNILNEKRSQNKNENKNDIFEDNIKKNSLKKENKILEVDKNNNNILDNKQDNNNKNNINNNENLSNSIIDINQINSKNKKSNISDLNNNENKNKKKQKKDYNKINQIVQVESLFIKSNNIYGFEILNLSNYIEKMDNNRKYKDRYSFAYTTNNRILFSNKKKETENKSDIQYEKIIAKKLKSMAKRKSAIIPIKKILSYQNDEFKRKLENSNINNTNENHTDEKIISSTEEELNSEENSKNDNDNDQKKKFLEEYRKYKEKRLQEKLTNRKIIDKIDKYDKFDKLKLKKEKSFLPFYKTQRHKKEGLNKFELNFFGSRKINYNKTALNNKVRKRKTRNSDEQPLLELLNSSDEELEESSEDDEISDENVNELENKDNLKDGKIRRQVKSATLNFIANRYKELEERKSIKDINQAIINNSNKYQLFTNVNLESVEDIEYNKTLLLYKLKEDIRYKISQGKCERTEMEEFEKFENKLNEYKINYNLKDTNKIKEYVLLLLTKFNEYIELETIREKRKTEETRINKFMNNLYFDLDYNIPLSRMLKGKKCSAKNFNPNLSRLSEIRK